MDFGRTRIRNISTSPVDSYFGEVINGQVSPHPSGLLTNWGGFATLYESIQDFKEPFSTENRYPDHPVRHVRVKGGMFEVPDWTYRSPESEYRPDYPGTLVGFRPPIQFAGGLPDWELVPSVPSALLDELAYNAMRRFSDDIQQQASLLNFLYELKDFKNLIGPIRGLLHRLMDDWMNKPGLTWEFAIRPFIDDVLKIIGSFGYVKQRIEFLKSHNGQETIVSYTSDKVAERMSFLSQGPLLLDFSDNWDFKQTRVYVTDLKITFRAHSRIRINAEFLDDLSRQMDAYASALGIGSLFDWLKAGYKAIPFSWLFDFFFKTNRLLDKLDVSQFSSLGSSPIEVLTTTWSLKRQATFEYYSRRPSSDVLVKAGEYKLLDYSRNSGLPFDESSTWLRFQSLFSNKDMLLILLQILLPGFRSRIKGRKRKIVV